MPNWCDCILIVKGKLADLTGFFEENREVRESRQKREENADNAGPPFSVTLEVFPEDPLSKLSFMRALPTPEEFRHKNVGATDMNEAFGSAKPTNWYTWQIRHWGTKWDASDVRVYRGHKPERLIYVFSTAWSPPTPWMEYVAGKYPHLAFELQFSEGGCDFSGKRKFKNGVIINPGQHEDDYRPLRYPKLTEEIK